ncbi:saccharopine dehydrogenase [Roseovarius sp. SCSIO 43702]|uniref:saccharopine dehydrogenase n=1 Tax=Roseovarius sp. SCSIO 43702 TaxID=2823043 RepID=UPI001C737E17|nr:saccharopine dehydrogenase [Roseovarius sp. SCSIO 43702]QYX57264.1 saccharopine dehydrogenase [Roseovarius sp. SCSIO 43702]
MTHLWVRAEQRPNEERVGLMPGGARALIAQGFDVTVEESRQRAVPIDAYRDAGCRIVPEASWPDAPDDAVIFGLKELPEDGTPLRHRHIMFGHAYKGQHSGRALLERFAAGGGTLYDLEYLVDGTGRRVAAFGYWAGYAGAGVSALAWGAQRRGEVCPPVDTWPGKDAMLDDLRTAMGDARPRAIVIGARGRVGTGAADLCEALGISVTRWDMEETARGGPFPEILDHDLFLNCILARPGTPVFVPKDAVEGPRKLSVIGDVACDPDSDYNPVPLYDTATTWTEPVVRVATEPALDVMAIDNLPSLLPRESSEDFAGQLLSHLKQLDDMGTGVWGRAEAEFRRHASKP